MGLQRRYGGVSHMWVERRLDTDPSFPRPVFFGRIRFWKLSDLEKWEKAQSARCGKARLAHDASAARAGKRGRS